MGSALPCRAGELTHAFCFPAALQHTGRPVCHRGHCHECHTGTAAGPQTCSLRPDAAMRRHGEKWRCGLAPGKPQDFCLPLSARSHRRIPNGPRPRCGLGRRWGQCLPSVCSPNLSHFLAVPLLSTKCSVPREQRFLYCAGWLCHSALIVTRAAPPPGARLLGWWAEHQGEEDELGM